jgi:hypothetical protein
MKRPEVHIRRPHNELYLALDARNRTSGVELTDYVLDDNLHRSQRHISTGNLFSGSCTPLVWRYRLEKMFHGWE